MKEEQQTNADELIKRLPEGYERACFENKAIERRREIKSPVDLIDLSYNFKIFGEGLARAAWLAERTSDFSEGKTQ